MTGCGMPEAEEEFMLSFYRRARVILEYGSGASTRSASQLHGKYVLSVENDLTWARNLRAELLRGGCQSQVLVYHVNLGQTGPWGRVRDESGWKSYHRYPNAIWDELYFRHPDVVLIDGRFRTACLISTMLHAKKPMTVLFDDYINRPKYRLIERLIQPREVVGRMARFDVVPGQIPPEHIGFAIKQFFEVTVHGRGAAAYEVPQEDRKIIG
jgi:hypothetical protein